MENENVKQIERKPGSRGPLPGKGTGGPGRPKGQPNKITKDVRKMIAYVAEKNAPELEDWLHRVAKKNPEKAVDLYLRMIEYHIPKLSRTEVSGPGGGPIETKHIREEIHTYFDIKDAQEITEDNQFLGYDGICEEDD